MTIRDFIEAINECAEVVYRLFDCNTEELVFMATDDAENTCEFNRDDLLYSKYEDYEDYGVDISIHNGKIYIEFNIEVEEDDYDEEDF